MWLKSLFVNKPDLSKDAHFYLLAKKKKKKEKRAGYKLQFCSFKLGTLDTYKKICHEELPEIYEA